MYTINQISKNILYLKPTFENRIMEIEWHRMTSKLETVYNTVYNRRRKLLTKF